MSPWGLPNWLAVEPLQKKTPADSDPAVYLGCEAGCPADMAGCAADESSREQDIWTRLYSQTSNPAVSRDDARHTELLDISGIADTVGGRATATEMGALAADERHSRGQADVASLNRQQQGLSGTHLTVKLRIGFMPEDDAIVAANTVAAQAQVSAHARTPAPASCWDDEEACMGAYYDRCTSNIGACEYDFYHGCEAACRQQNFPAAEDCDWRVARRPHMSYDACGERFVDEVLEDIVLTPEITREDLLTPSLPEASPWVEDEIRRAHGAAACRDMLNCWAYLARCGGECLRSLSHGLADLADDIDPAPARQAADPQPAADDSARHAIPEEYLGW